MKPRELAFCAVMTALLIAAQYVLSFVAGVELVTVMLLSFSRVFGPKCGAITAAAFSILRCAIYGFFPNVLVLYLLYYCPFAAVCGAVGRFRLPDFVCPALLFCLCGGSAWLAAVGLPVSALYKTKLRVLFAAIFLISAALAVLYIVSAKKKSESKRELAQMCAIAVVGTVLFTLIDDIVTPLFMGYSKEAAAGYFYGGMITMATQTVCAAASVFLLYPPLKRAFGAVSKKCGENIDKRSDDI